MTLTSIHNFARAIWCNILKQHLHGQNCIEIQIFGMQEKVSFTYMRVGWNLGHAALLVTRQASLPASARALGSDFSIRPAYM